MKLAAGDLDGPVPPPGYGSIQDQEDGGGERVRLLADAGEYNDDNDDATRASAPQALVNTVTSFLGVGLYALPYAFSLMGLYSSVALMSGMGLVAVYVISILVASVRFVQLKWPRGVDISYGLLGREAFGRWGVGLVTASIVLSQLGFCCAYLIFIGKTLELLFGVFSVPQYIGIVLPAVVALSLLRDLRYLSPTSLTANIVLLTAVISLFVFGFRDSWNPSENKYGFVRATWPVGFGQAVFSMSGINLAIPIYTGMRRRSEYFPVANAGLLVVTLLYVLVGSFGYIFYGDDVQDIVLYEILGSTYGQIINGLLALQILFSYPLQLFPVTQMTESALGLLDADVAVSWRETKRNLVRLSIVGITAVFATQIPLFSLVSALVGAFATSTAIFLLPPAIHSRLFWATARWHMHAVNATVFLLGLAGAAVSSYYVLVEIVRCLSTGDEACE